MPKILPRAGESRKSSFAEIIRFSQRWTFTLPKNLRHGLSVDQVFEIEKRDDGVIELRPRVLIDPAQAWFWSPAWQQMEREADEDIAAGRVDRFDSVEDLFSDLDAFEPE